MAKGVASADAHMGEWVNTPAPVMGTVSPCVRARIVSGMRWTLWLSIITAPLGYGTTVVLARAGPDVLGTYGLLMVYLAVASSLLYLGGDAVTIKFIPALPTQERLSFLVSYYLTICGAMLPWLAVGAMWPRTLHWLFGDHGGEVFELTMLCLTPIYVASMMVSAALKAVLDMGWAQILARIMTVLTFVVYAVLYAFGRDFLRTHYTGVIWGVYLCIAGMIAVIGLIRLRSHEEWRSEWKTLRFRLPHGFWRYTLGIQQISALGFFSQRLDMVLVLNYGDVTVLGKYVAILAVAGLMSVASRCFVDTLLPALTTLLARQEFVAASEVFATHLRLLFAVSVSGTCTLVFCVTPLIGIMGSQYIGDRAAFIVLVVLSGLALPGSLGGTLLSGMGKQQRSVWIGLAQLLFFVLLFIVLWPMYHLCGVVLASGGSLLVSSIMLLITASRSGPVAFPYVREYVCCIVVGCGAGAIALWVPSLRLSWVTLACTLSTTLFLLGAGYTLAELRTLVRCFVPGGQEELSSWGGGTSGAV